MSDVERKKVSLLVLQKLDWQIATGSWFRGTKGGQELRADIRLLFGVSARTQGAEEATTESPDQAAQGREVGSTWLVTAFAVESKKESDSTSGGEVRGRSKPRRKKDHLNRKKAGHLREFGGLEESYGISIRMGYRTFMIVFVSLSTLCVEESWRDSECDMFSCLKVMVATKG